MASAASGDGWSQSHRIVKRGSRATLQTITWDVENRPTDITGGASFVYDGDGKRVKKTENGQTTVYVNRYYEKNVTTSEVTTHYYLGAKQIALRKGATLSYLSQDHLTGTSVISDASGASTGTIRYLPFGETRSTSGAIPTEKKFTGQRLDSTGLYYYGARYYDSTIGRFISPDSLVQSLSNPQTLNRYSYVVNNPLQYIDPTGRRWADPGYRPGGESLPPPVPPPDPVPRPPPPPPPPPGGTSGGGGTGGTNGDGGASGTSSGSGSGSSGSGAGSASRGGGGATDSGGNDADVGPSVSTAAPRPELPINLSAVVSLSMQAVSQADEGAAGPWRIPVERRGPNWYGLGNAVVGSIEVAVGSVGVTVSVLWTAGALVPTLGGSVLVGVPVAQLSYLVLQDGILRVSAGELRIPSLLYFPFPY